MVMAEKFSDDPLEQLKADHIFDPLNSMEEMNDWFFTYFGLRFPAGVIYEDSTHGPADAIWRIYELMKTGESATVPEIILYSSRDSGKTVAASAAMILCLVHFRFSVALASATLDQTQKPIQYNNQFFSKISPYLKHHGWKQIGDSKSKIEWILPDGEQIYVRVLPMTKKGMNCIHPNSQIETRDGLKKAKNISVGEFVKTRDVFLGEDVYVRIKDIGYTEKYSHLISFDNGATLICSPDHQIFTRRGWIPSDQLKLGMEVISSEEVYASSHSEDEEFEVKRDLEQIILGTLLGDASITRTPAGKARYKVAHCKSQEEYIDIIKSVFEENNYHITKYIGKRKSGVGYENSEVPCHVFTRTHDTFKRYHEITYKNGKKTVTKEWLDKLTFEGFAYFVMDDGSVSSDTVGRTKESPITLATCSFSIEENQLIVNKLKEWGVDSEIVTVYNTKSSYPAIRISIDGSRFLSEKMEPYFVNCLRYKLRTPKAHRDFGRYLDSGKTFINSKNRNIGFRFENKKPSKNRKTAEFVRSQFNTKVTKITRLGKRKLIDLVVDTEKEHLKSFYANSIFLHNSEHLPMLFCDEIDLVQDTAALDEAKMVPTSYKGFSPLMVSLSTMKYAGGNMEKKVKSALAAGGEVLKWSILDVTKPISPEEAKVDEPKKVRYLRELPFGNLTEEKWLKLPEKEQLEYERVEVYAGIVDHPLLPVMKNMLVGLEVNDSPIYKNHTAVLNNFKQVMSTSMEMAAAQLLCKKPSSAGLVYPRFNSQNILTVEQAYEKVFGETREGITIEELREELKKLDIQFMGGMDFGFTDYTSMIVLAILPSGDTLLVDSFLADKLELDDIVKYAKELNTNWNVERWYVDQAYPAYIKTLKRSGMSVPEFTKVVIDGIAATQFKICDVQGRRKFFIVNHAATQHIPECFGQYSWQKDRAGDPIEGKPHHDDEYVSDVMDSIRYPMQVLFSKRGKITVTTAVHNNAGNQIKPVKLSQSNYDEKKVMEQQIQNHILQTTGVSIGQVKDLTENTKKKGKVFWSK